MGTASNAEDALQEAALEQSWGEGFLSKETGRPEKAISVGSSDSCRGWSGPTAPGLVASFSHSIIQLERKGTMAHSSFQMIMEWGSIFKDSTLTEEESFLISTATLCPSPTMTRWPDTPCLKEPESLLGDFGILIAPTPTLHVQMKISNDYCLLTHFFFLLLCFTETHFSAHTQLLLTQTHCQGPCPPTLPVEELHLY